MESMVIFNLQRCQPSVLPCLQQIIADLLERYTDVKSFTEMLHLNDLLQFNSDNNESLAQLFFIYLSIIYLNLISQNMWRLFAWVVLSKSIGQSIKKIQINSNSFVLKNCLVLIIFC
jgi:hypothetical protein